MEIDHRLLQGAVTEVGADLADRCPGIEEVGGVGVSQGVGGDLLVGLQEPALSHGDLHGLLGRGCAHGLLAHAHGLGLGHLGTLPAPGQTRKEPLAIAVGLPEPPQTDKQFGRDGNLTGLPALGIHDPDDEALAIDVLGLEMGRLAQAQTAVIDDGKEGAEASLMEGREQKGDLVTGQHVRERLDAPNLELGPDVPLPAQMVAVEIAKGGEGLVERAAGQLALGLEVKQEVEDLVGFQARGDFPGIMSVDLPGPVEVDTLGALGKPFELDKAVELTIPRSGGDVWFFLLSSYHARMPNPPHPFQTHKTQSKAQPRRAAAPFNKSAQATRYTLTLSKVARWPGCG